VQALASGYGVNVRVIDDRTVGVSFGEAITKDDTLALLRAFGIDDGAAALNAATATFSGEAAIPPSLARSSPFLTHPVFNTHRSETQMLRYLKHLENKDLSLNWSMISLGSCTMKLNAASGRFINTFILSSLPLPLPLLLITSSHSIPNPIH
jgi:glycine dehydrogenase